MKDDEEFDNDYESPYSDEDGSGGDYESPNEDGDAANDYEPPPTEPPEDMVHKLCPTMPIGDGDYIGTHMHQHDKSRTWTDNKNWTAFTYLDLFI